MRQLQPFSRHNDGCAAAFGAKLGTGDNLGHEETGITARAIHSARRHLGLFSVSGRVAEEQAETAGMQAPSGLRRSASAGCHLSGLPRSMI